MTTQDWIHRFPRLTDQFAVYVDWPTAGYDTHNNSVIQHIFTALAAIQNYLINWVRWFISWSSLDGWSVITDGTGSVDLGVGFLGLNAGNLTDNDTYIVVGPSWNKLVVAGKRVIVEWLIQSMEANTHNEISLLMHADPDVPPSVTEDHFGFWIENGDLYATNGDGAVQKITDTIINLSTGAQLTRLRVVLNSGTDCRFYVDGVLKVTHTDNLPDAEDYGLVMGIRTKADVGKGFGIGPVLIERET